MDILRRIKWAWQRVYRGWDDRVVWSIDWYLCEMLPVWMERLIKTTHGIPFGITEEKWNRILQEIADGFRVGEKMLNGDSFAWDTYDEILSDLGVSRFVVIDGKHKHSKIADDLWDSMEVSEKIKAETQSNYNKTMHALDLFKEHFFDL